MKLTRAKLLVLVAFSVPVAVELRVLFGFFGVELPLTAVIAFEAVFLLAIAVAYMLSAEPKSAANH
jgi:hypothetical protein